MSNPPCATIEKLSAADPIERSDCAIFPPTELSPASARNELTLSLIPGTPRSEPHSMAEIDLSTSVERHWTDRDSTNLSLAQGRKGLWGCERELLGLSAPSGEVRSLAFDPRVLRRMSVSDRDIQTCLTRYSRKGLYTTPSTGRFW